MRLPIDPQLSFRFSIPCYRKENLITETILSSWPSHGLNLPPIYSLPHMESLSERNYPVDFRLAWDTTGLGFSFRVWDKSHKLDCRVPITDSGDNIQLWLDTRNTTQIHRAVRSCHRFAIFPTGDGNKMDQPGMYLIPIHLAKESPKEVPHENFYVRSVIRPSEYLVEGLIPARFLTDYRPAELPRLGFAWVVQDKDHGRLTLTASEPVPYPTDPSFWWTLELQDLPTV